MIKTTSVANAIIRYIASNIVIIPPPFKKGVANRSLDNLMLIIAYSARVKRNTFSPLWALGFTLYRLYIRGVFYFVCYTFHVPLLLAKFTSQEKL